MGMEHGAHATSDAELASLIEPTSWTDKDTDIVVQSMVDDEMNLGTVTKLD